MVSRALAVVYAADVEREEPLWELVGFRRQT